MSRRILIAGKYKLVISHFPVFIYHRGILFAGPANVQISLTVLFRKSHITQLYIYGSMRFTIQHFSPFCQFLSTIGCYIPMEYIFIQIREIVPVLDTKFHVLPVK